jgi:DNA-binding NtrC family response regulator
MNEDTGRILIVDDEDEIRWLLTHLMKKQGYEVLMAADGTAAIDMMCRETPDVILLDIRMPGLTGIEVMQRLSELGMDIPVILITGFATIQEAVEVMRAGAYDYVAKPFDQLQILQVVQRALGERKRKNKLQDMPVLAHTESSLMEIMGHSEKIRNLVADVNRVAKSDFSVILLGETGSGKELVATAIHQASGRFGGPFIPVDCGAIPETLIESELFGHEKGAYTGAHSQKLGKFEAANNGTLFLDEIANMPLCSQARLLRVLQQKMVTRLGSSKLIPVDVRLIAASNKDLQACYAHGEFRRDLYYRLNEFTIHIPPLRERKDDIFYLAKRFLEITNIELGKNVKTFSDQALEILYEHSWPGNVRCLKSVIRRAVLLAEDIITEKHLEIRGAPAPDLTPNPAPTYTALGEELPWKSQSLKQIIKNSNISMEREVIIQVLKYTGGNKAKAARLLQVDYKTIHTKAKKFGISTTGKE